jgi:hypothetical protein
MDSDSQTVDDKILIKLIPVEHTHGEQEELLEFEVEAKINESSCIDK